MVVVPYFTIIGVLILGIATMTVYSSFHVVEEGDVEALLVFGQMKTVLHPGINFVPPFVSRTYPIDPRTMLVDTGHERVDVPDEFEDDVREGPDRTTSGSPGSGFRRPPM